MSTATTHEPVKVGDVLYREVHHRGNPSKIVPVTVTRIGRKYLYVTDEFGRVDDDHSVDKMTLYHRSDYVPVSFQLYRSREEIIYKHRRNKLWSELSKVFRAHGIPEHITLDQLTDIARILGIELTEVE